tara:strand:+ start:10 stop:327 length:318 start_codon:yes stop_codon:yes gene_type:complete
MRYLIYSLLIFFASCTDEAKKEMPGPCGTATKEINYPSDVKPIIREHCISCHKDYIFYDSLNQAILTREFYKRVLVTRDMPPSGGLDTCDYIILKRWIYNGHSNK